MALKLVLLSALVAVALADNTLYRPPPPPPSYSAPTPSYHAPAPSYNAHQPVSPPKYDFSWNVKDDYSGNNYGHQEARDGYDTQGSYYVQLPDGRLQKVTYTVNGDSGFVAQVNYQDEAQYPTQKGYGSAPSYQAPAPFYKAPAPSYQAPAPSYKAPAPSYKAPAPSYKAPAPSYQAPAPSNQAPAPSYQQPRPSYA